MYILFPLIGPAESVHSLRISPGATGYSYEAVFERCLDGNVHFVTVQDPYIRVRHQIHNFVRFCELLVKKCKKLSKISLTTTHGESPSEVTCVRCPAYSYPMPSTSRVIIRASFRRPPPWKLYSKTRLGHNTQPNQTKIFVVIHNNITIMNHNSQSYFKVFSYSFCSICPQFPLSHYLLVQGAIPERPSLSYRETCVAYLSNLTHSTIQFLAPVTVNCRRCIFNKTVFIAAKLSFHLYLITPTLTLTPQFLRMHQMRYLTV